MAFKLGMTGDILNQGAAQGNVYDLMTPADAQNGFPQVEKTANQGDLVPVPIRIDPHAGGVGLPVMDGVHIGTAGNQQGVAVLGCFQLHGQHRFRAAGPEGGQIILKVAGLSPEKNTLHKRLLS